MSTDPGTQANVERFDEIARSWDDNPVRTELARAIGTAILEWTAPRGEECAMEFGCGTGLVTALLAPALGRVAAVDNSEGMLEVLRGKAQALGLDNVEPRRADIGSEIPGGPYDLIFSAMTLHHIHGVRRLLRRLAGKLAPGGRLAVADLETEDGSFHGEAEGIMHLGFDPGVVAAWLREAGLEGVSTRRVHVVHKTAADEREHAYPVFLATASAPGAG